MSRVETIGNATIYLGDCRAVLGSLDSFDLVVTDPPYGTGGWRRDEGGQGSNPRGKLIKEDWDSGATDWLKLCRLAPVMAFAPATPKWLAGFEAAGYVKFRWLYMRKLDPRPQVGGRTAWSIEPICVASLDGFQLYGGTDWKDASTPRLGRDEDGTGHPYQKPVEVMTWLIDKTKAVTVVDPFMGSGTTGVAAVRLGRKFIGVEMDEKYFDMARKRIEDAAKQPDMFAEPDNWSAMWSKPLFPQST